VYGLSDLEIREEKTMIKVVGNFLDEPGYSVIYNQSARVLDIETNPICDDCIPFEESTGCMFWLDKNKTTCEIECIFPIMADSIGNWIGHDVKPVKSSLKLDVSYEEKPVEVVLDREELILVFRKDKKVDRKYLSSNVTFCVSGDELVAMICREYKLV
jgi:hypothetical protein